MKNLIKLSAAATVALAIGACASRNSTKTVGEEPIQTKTEQLAEKRGEHIVTNIAFDKGTKSLTPAARAELDKAIAAARAQGEIEDITVAVWSDMEYPGKARKLTSSQVKLAEDRGDEIEDYLSEDLNVSSYRVGVHNMGEKPNFLSDFFKTADADLKDQLTAEGIAPTADAPITGHASSALVLIKLK